MTKPPPKKQLQKDYVQSAVRMPPELRDELKAAAEENGRSFNAEIVARLTASPDERIVAELALMRTMLQRLIDRD